jgi:hypothetical protein
MVDVTNFVGSETLAAMRNTVGLLGTTEGAVYEVLPPLIEVELLIDPQVSPRHAGPSKVQKTPLLLVSFRRVTVNFCVVETVTVAREGFTETDIAGGVTAEDSAPPPTFIAWACSKAGSNKKRNENLRIIAP